MPYGIGKANGLAHLLSIIGVDKEEVIAIGDGYNDLNMISYAGLGVALKNAAPEVCQVADYVMYNNNNEGGVAEAIEKFVLERG